MEERHYSVLHVHYELEGLYGSKEDLCLGTVSPRNDANTLEQTPGIARAPPGTEALPCASPLAEKVLQDEEESALGNSRSRTGLPSFPSSPHRYLIQGDNSALNWSGGWT